MMFKYGDVVRFVLANEPNVPQIGTVTKLSNATNELYVLDSAGREWKCNQEDVVLDTECDTFEKTITKGDSKYHDGHYSKMAAQPIEVMQAALTPAEFKGFLRGSIIKYLLRAGNKSGEPYEKDMAKAKRYREWLLQAECGLIINPRE